MVWILTLSYWVHLLTTVLWLGGLALLALIAFPAWQRQELADNQWLMLQKRFAPWVNASMVLLWISGFIQMTNDSHYEGFMVISSTWAWAMLLKHIAAIAMTGLGLYMQFSVLPSFDRMALAQINSAETTTNAAFLKQQRTLLQLNVGIGILILLCTAVATAL